MVGPIKWPYNQSFGIASTIYQMEWLCGPLSIRLIPENAVGNDVSKCAAIRETASGTLHYIATTTPPQEYDLPLVNGFSNHYCAKYCKTQDGMVTVMFWLSGSAGENTETTVATLPQGFRPTALFRATGITDTGSIQSQHQCGIAVNESGAIVIQSPFAWGFVSGIFTFRAAN